MRNLRRLFRVALFGSVGLLVALLFPAYTLLVLLGAFMLLLFAQHLNFYRMVMILKRFVRDARQLYLENRLKLRTGFRDYGNVELEKSSRIHR